MLERLDEVGLDGVLEQRRHGARRVEVGRRDGLAGVGVGDDHAAQALLQVHEVRGEAERRHDLGCDGDVEPVLAGDPLHAAAQTVDNVAELAVVHIDGALPHDLLGIDTEGVALLDMVVEHCGEQVVGSADRMEVAREMQVDVLHGDDLRVPAARGAALDAEDRAERGLAEREHRLLAEAVETLR